MTLLTLGSLFSGTKLDTDALASRPYFTGDTGKTGALLTAVTTGLSFSGIQWRNNGANISNATSRSYVRQSSDGYIDFVLSGVGFSQLSTLPSAQISLTLGGDSINQFASNSIGGTQQFFSQNHVVQANARYGQYANVVQSEAVAGSTMVDVLARLPTTISLIPTRKTGTTAIFDLMIGVNDIAQGYSAADTIARIKTFWQTASRYWDYVTVSLSYGSENYSTTQTAELLKLHGLIREWVSYFSTSAKRPVIYDAASVFWSASQDPSATGKIVVKDGYCYDRGAAFRGAAVVIGGTTVATINQQNTRPGLDIGVLGTYTLSADLGSTYSASQSITIGTIIYTGSITGTAMTLTAASNSTATHPTVLGASALAAEWDNAVHSIVAPQRYSFNGVNLLANATFSALGNGTQGTGVTGVKPDNWRVQQNNSSVVSAVASIVGGNLRISSQISAALTALGGWSLVALNQSAALSTLPTGTRIRSGSRVIIRQGSADIASINLRIVINDGTARTVYDANASSNRGSYDASGGDIVLDLLTPEIITVGPLSSVTFQIDVNYAISTNGLVSSVIDVVANDPANPAFFFGADI